MKPYGRVRTARKITRKGKITNMFVKEEIQRELRDYTNRYSTILSDPEGGIVMNKDGKEKKPARLVTRPNAEGKLEFARISVPVSQSYYQSHSDSEFVIEKVVENKKKGTKVTKWEVTGRPKIAVEEDIDREVFYAWLLENLTTRLPTAFSALYNDKSQKDPDKLLDWLESDRTEVVKASFMVKPPKKERVIKTPEQSTADYLRSLSKEERIQYLKDQGLI